MKIFHRKPKTRVNDHLSPKTLADAKILTGEQLATAILMHQEVGEAAGLGLVVSRERLERFLKVQEEVQGRVRERFAKWTAPGVYHATLCNKCKHVWWANRREGCPACGHREQLYVLMGPQLLAYALGKIG